MTIYVAGAHPDDRHVAAPCGCVFVVRKLAEFVRSGKNKALAEEFWKCVPCQALSGRPAALMHLDVDLIAAGIYHHQSDGNGVPWQ